MKSMKKVICICASALLLGGTSVFAQGEMDAYKFSQYDLNGTARYLGMVHNGVLTSNTSHNH